ncbi:hypothetical protein D8B46_01395 [Candidatus Gracilibacteria bacterium]|nr:MAG: hypothetical protein D8B46_01395 [Candidatus Gracilibacteria bacterium]
MKKIEFNLKGSFGEKEIKGVFYLVPGNKKVVVNIHGLYGSGKGTDDKYIKFAEKFQDKGVSSSLFYSSSRLNVENDDSLGKFENKQKKFFGKTFENELDDAKIVLTYILKNSVDFLGIKQEDLEITLNGNSLGGMISFYLAEEFSQVKNISTVGTGAWLDLGQIPIIDTLPQTEIFLEKVSDFEGNFLMNEAGLDDIFTKEAYNKLFEASLKANKSRILFDGVDHSFKLLNGEKSVLPYEKIFKNVKSLVEKGKLVTKKF